MEKKKDYVLRARDYHKKKTEITNLRRKAAFRNPDEFYFAMNKTKTKDGVHQVGQGHHGATYIMTIYHGESYCLWATSNLVSRMIPA